jgi:penicillin-binding protein 2
VDFAGKTGSTQLVSHAFIQSHGPNAKQQYKGNGWFAGVTPRRNPEIVVVVFFEGGEHGDKAAPIAAQVIKAYVDKQRRVRSDPLLFSDKADPGSVPMASLWSAPAGDGDNPGHPQAEVAEANREEHFRGGTFVLKLPAARKMERPPAIGASALPGGN